jgi:hypothetical protein
MVRCGIATPPPGCGRAAVPARPGGQPTQSLLSRLAAPQPGPLPVSQLEVAVPA